MIKKYLCIQLDNVLAKMPLNILEHRHGLGPVHQVDGQPVLANPASPTDPAQNSQSYQAVTHSHTCAGKSHSRQFQSHPLAGQS